MNHHAGEVSYCGNESERWGASLVTSGNPRHQSHLNGRDWTVSSSFPLSKWGQVFLQLIWVWKGQGTWYLNLKKKKSRWHSGKYQHLSRVHSLLEQNRAKGLKNFPGDLKLAENYREDSLHDAGKYYFGPLDHLLIRIGYQSCTGHHLPSEKGRGNVRGRGQRTAST